MAFSLPESHQLQFMISQCQQTNSNNFDNLFSDQQQQQQGDSTSTTPTCTTTLSSDNIASTTTFHQNLSVFPPPSPNHNNNMLKGSSSSFTNENPLIPSHYRSEMDFNSFNMNSTTASAVLGIPSSADGIVERESTNNMQLTTNPLDPAAAFASSHSPNSLSNTLHPTTKAVNSGTGNHLFNRIVQPLPPQQQHRSNHATLQRSRSLSMQNPLRRDVLNQITMNNTSIDGNSFMSYNNNTSGGGGNITIPNHGGRQHLHSPSSSSLSNSSSVGSFASLSTEGLTNAPLMDNASFQRTSSLPIMNCTVGSPMDKIIQNKVKKTRSSPLSSKENNMELSDSMMLDGSNSSHHHHHMMNTANPYQYFGGFNTANTTQTTGNNNGNNIIYSPTGGSSTCGGFQSMEQSPPPSPLATFLSQIDISKLTQEQWTALQVLCMSNQSNLATPPPPIVCSNHTNSNEGSTTPNQRRSSVVSYMSDDTSPRDSLLKTVLQKQFHTTNELIDENQELCSMIDNALSGCKSSLGLRLVANETPVNTVPTITTTTTTNRTSRTLSSPPQLQMTLLKPNNIQPEAVSPMSRSSSEEAVSIGPPTIEIPNNNNNTQTFNFGSFGSEYEQTFENSSEVHHQRHHSSPAINRVEKPTKTKRRSSSLRCANASSSTGQLEQTMVASVFSAVASTSTSAGSKKGSRRNSISSIEQQPISVSPTVSKQSKTQNNYNKAIVFNNYYDEIQFKKKYGPNSTFYKFK